MIVLSRSSISSKSASSALRPSGSVVRKDGLRRVDQIRRLFEPGKQCIICHDGRHIAGEGLGASTNTEGPAAQDGPSSFCRECVSRS